jgi:hypothetical protein
MSPKQGIGVLSSIAFTGTGLEAAFRKGLGAGVHMTVKDRCGYEPRALHNAVQALNNDIELGLIATVGGLIVAQAAASATGATLPYISLVGGTPGAFPSPGQGYFRGGVSLETFAHNPHRVAYLRAQHGIPENKVCLLSNPNSYMSGVETAAWVAAGRGPVIAAGAGNGAGTANDVQTYRPAFAKIEAAGMQAVVVSADPYFKDSMDELIAVANAWMAGGKGRRVCYPLNDYATGKVKPAPGHTLHGPDLEDAYEVLGNMAANFLASRPTMLQIVGISAARDF